jgi:hypothetical protein
VGGADAGTEAGHHVVGVGAGRDVREAVTFGERRQDVEQLGLAEVAAVTGVRAVALALHLVRRRREHPHSEVLGERARRRPLALRQRPGVGGRGADVLRPEGAHGRCEQEGAVRPAAVGDQQRAPGAEVLLEHVEPQPQDVVVEPPGELGQVLQHDVGARVPQLLLGAPSGEHRDAERVGGAGALDVVDVVAHVDGGAVLRERRALAGAPHLTDQLVDIEAERLEVQHRVGAVLPGHHDGAPTMPPYRLERLGDAGERLGGSDRVLRVVRAEPVDESGQLVGRVVRGEQVVERRAEPGAELVHVELDTGLLGQHRHRRGEPGTGVDERHVEVETHDQRSRASHEVRVCPGSG